jgi:hypothetical protein
VVLHSSTIWDLKEELQSWGLLHEHVTSGRLTPSIRMKRSIRNLELSKPTDDDAAICAPQSVPQLAVLAPPKHRVETAATVPAAETLCVDVCKYEIINLALSHSVSPIPLHAALR